MTNKPTPVSEAQKDLYKALADFTAEESPAERIEVIFETLYSALLAKIGAPYDRTVDYNKVFEIRESHLNMIYTMGRLMVHVARVDEAWARIEKEVSRD